MDATLLARSLLNPVAAFRTFGIDVLRAADGAAEVALTVTPEFTNVIGSLHASGLIALVDAAGLAAIIASCTDEAEFHGVIPLGATATLAFHAPARGRLIGSCRLDDPTTDMLRHLLDGARDRVRFTTAAAITDATGTVVCHGTFDWSIRRID